MRNLILTICSNYKCRNGEAQKYDANMPRIINDPPDDKKRIESAEIEEIRQCYGEVVNWATAEGRKYHFPNDVDY